MSRHWTREPGARWALLGPNGALVDCPTCGAPRGYPCNAPQEGKAAEHYCPQRVDAARALEDES